MPATKRKYSASKYSSGRPLKRRNAIQRTYSGATSRIVPLSMDHQLLRTKQNCVLRYHETFSINPTVGGIPGSHVFRSNSCYDPNFTGVGHQPRGFDQIMAMYQYCAVREAQIEIWFQSTDGLPIVLGIQADGSSGAVTRDNMMEGRTAVYKAAGGLSASGPGYISLRVKPWQLAGTKMDENDYKHSAVANPAITQYFVVNGMPLKVQDSGEITCVARITYHCQVTEPVSPTSS